MLPVEVRAMDEAGSDVELRHSNHVSFHLLFLMLVEGSSESPVPADTVVATS